MVRALLGAGALILGKTNLHELSFGWTSTNLAFGAVCTDETVTAQWIDDHRFW